MLCVGEWTGSAKFSEEVYIPARSNIFTRSIVALALTIQIGSGNILIKVLIGLNYCMTVV